MKLFAQRIDGDIKSFGVRIALFCASNVLSRCPSIVSFVVQERTPMLIVFPLAISSSLPSPSVSTQAPVDATTLLTTAFVVSQDRDAF